MNIIKLNAIDSTNTFLKDLSVTENLENFTIVSTENQTKGKGQRGNVWFSESGKNLTFSVYLKDFDVQKYSPFLLNILVPISIIEILETYNLPNIFIKWPNDIMADNKKMGGILIESVFKNQNTLEIIVGIGLNINQTQFNDLQKVTSLALIFGKEVNIEELLITIVNQFKLNYSKLKQVDANYFWNKYHQKLFRKDKPSVFLDKNKKLFQAIIQRVTYDGKLELLLEDDTLKIFDIKEITLKY